MLSVNKNVLPAGFPFLPFLPSYLSAPQGQSNHVSFASGESSLATLIGGEHSFGVDLSFKFGKEPRERLR